MPEYRVHFDHSGQPVRATIPRYVFKFAAVNEYTLASLSESYLWFSRPREFNDLFELPTKSPTSLAEDEMREYLRINFRHHLPKFGIEVPAAETMETWIDRALTARPGFLVSLFRVFQESRFDVVRIHCLSMRYDDPLMWAHYAGSNSGVCLVYHFPHLISGPWFPLQVKYVDTPPTFNQIRQSLAQLAAPTPYENAVAHIEHDQLQFGTKLMPWSHEQELRLCTLKEEPKQPYPRAALCGVVFGPRISHEAELDVRRAVGEGRKDVTYAALTVDVDKDLLRVPGLENHDIEIPVGGTRNLLKELKRERESRDA